jgi:hypothetical protein
MYTLQLLFLILKGLNLSVSQPRHIPFSVIIHPCKTQQKHARYHYLLLFWAKCNAPQVEIVSKVGHKMLVSHYYGDMSHSWPVTVNDSSKKEDTNILCPTFDTISTCGALHLCVWPLYLRVFPPYLCIFSWQVNKVYMYGICRGWLTDRFSPFSIRNNNCIIK